MLISISKIGGFITLKRPLDSLCQSCNHEYRIIFKSDYSMVWLNMPLNKSFRCITVLKVISDQSVIII